MDLAFPVLFLLPTHMKEGELQSWEEKLPTLTYDANEAEIIVGKVSSKERGEMELRRLGIQVEQVETLDTDDSPRVKRRRISGSATSQPSPIDVVELSSDTEDEWATPTRPERAGNSMRTVKIVRLGWLSDSIAKGQVLPVEKYLLFEAQKLPSSTQTTPKKVPDSPIDILKRAQEDAVGHPPPKIYGGRYRSHQPSEQAVRDMAHVKPPTLFVESTVDHDILDKLPPIPAFLQTTFSCQRSTKIHPPNEEFISQLKSIRETRRMINDKIGVRAYSTAIATLSAYPHTLQSYAEVDRLPGCGPKIAELFHEFKETLQLHEADAAASDPKLQTIKLFYNIWGVAGTTALDFYNKGWRDLDDVIEFGWATLTRSQQIGVKYYDEFLDKISRTEVEYIAGTVLNAANGLHPGCEMVIVGGYRRGKTMSGDVDLILSHRDEKVTHGLIERVVIALEKSKHITHTLTLSLANTERGQMPVSWKGNDKPAGSGFDTLDKALVVWQDPRIPAAAAAAADSDKKKNPNPHRRLDIIISPWKTVGCAVLGWTSETTFQRDLRRYCKTVKRLKFDSSGVRSRVDGAWVDLEDGGQGVTPDMLTAERRVFEGLELEWRAPDERCTG